MQGRISDTIRVVDVAAALGLLTRLPIRVDAQAAMARGARSAWAWPLAGLVVGAVAGLVAAGAARVGLPVAVAALLAIIVQVILTGAMHEDGLADSLDGLWGGWTPERRLEIMKDSHIGVYGVAGLVLAVTLRWQVLALLLASGASAVAVLAALGAASRVPMVLTMAALPPARPDGLGATVGRPGAAATALSVLVGGAIATLAVGAAAIALALGMAVAGGFWAVAARRRVGGQTGDILGASQQVCDMAGGLVLLAVLG